MEIKSVTRVPITSTYMKLPNGNYDGQQGEVFLHTTCQFVTWGNPAAALMPALYWLVRLGPVALAGEGFPVREVADPGA